MLQKRTNILFDQTIWDKLTILAQQQNTSIGKLVRKAVEKQYLSDEKTDQIKKAHELILKHRKTFKEKINYKELINAGRKY